MHENFLERSDVHFQRYCRGQTNIHVRAHRHAHHNTSLPVGSGVTVIQGDSFKMLWCGADALQLRCSVDRTQRRQVCTSRQISITSTAVCLNIACRKLSPRPRDRSAEMTIGHTFWPVTRVTRDPLITTTHESWLPTIAVSSRGH